MNEHQLEKQFARELHALNTDPQPIVLEITKLDALALLSAVQLASRHPEGSQNWTVQNAMRLVRAMQPAVAPDPSSALAEIIKRGWDSSFDSSFDEEALY